MAELTPIPDSMAEVGIVAAARPDDTAPESAVAPVIDPTTGALINPLTGETAKVKLFRPIYMHGLTDEQANIKNHTWQEFITLEHDFDAIQIVLCNSVTTDSTYQIDVGVIAAFSSTPGSIPVAADLHPAALYRCTFAGATTITVPAAVGNVFTFAYSDLIPLRSIPRTDVPGALPLLVVRIYPTTSGTNIHQVSRGTEWATGITFAGKTRQWFSCRKTSTAIIDLATDGGLPSNEASMNNPAQQNVSLIAGVRYVPRYPVTSVLYCGDSKDAASLATLTNRGVSAGLKAVWWLNGNGYRYDIFNIARGAWQTSDYFARLLAVLTQRDANNDFVCNPNAVIYKTWSPNDITLNGGTVTQALADAMFTRVNRLIAVCANRGIPLVLMTGTPRTTDATNATSSYSSGEDAIRQAFNTRVKSINIENVVIADTGGIVGNGATPELWAINSYTEDGLHESQAAYDVQYPLIVTALRSVI